MQEIERFAIEKIYCGPYQDRQYSFKLVRVNKPSQPLTRVVNVYNRVIPLPKRLNRYHAFILGNLNPFIINLLSQDREWFRDVWIKVSKDMQERNYILNFYNDLGVMYPREHIYYSYIDEKSILFLLEFNYDLKEAFDVESFTYITLYSNLYFTSSEYNSLPNKLGIEYSFKKVENNVDKAALQTKIINWEANGGKAFTYVNGYFVDTLSLTIPDNSFVEVLYDQSVISKETFRIGDLRTFESIKDDKLKYLIFRDNLINKIQYYDDNDIYIVDDSNGVKGLYYYRHKSYAMRNVTDKDYSLYTQFVNNQASALTNIVGGNIQDKKIVLFTRKSGVEKELIYSSLKLHELYKLPQNTELDVMTNHNYSISHFRAENLENSYYNKLMSLRNIFELTPELATNAVGYNGVTYYFAKNLVTITAQPSSYVTVNVPYLYRYPSYAFEYDKDGKFIGYYKTTGPSYVTKNFNVKYVEFLFGQTPELYSRYYNPTDTFTLRYSDFRILSAYFEGVNRVTNWEDITYNTNKVTITNNTVKLNEEPGKKIKVIYFNEPHVYDLELSFVDGTLYFPLTIWEDRGTGYQNQLYDVYPYNLEIFLNGYKLTYGIDYMLNFPYIAIVSKRHLDYTKAKQKIHIRCYGFTLDKDRINELEVRGFVNGGVLTRNGYYDIRDDRNFSVFIDGKMYNKSLVRYAEETNTVEIANPLNGLPYTVRELFTSIKPVTGLDTLGYFEENLATNKEISQLFNLVFGEPRVNEFNVISDHYYLYSITVSKIIHDILDGNIPESTYMSPYNDSTIHNLLNSEPYRSLLLVDPIRNNFQENLIEIHPHIGNGIISLNLYQYWFINNVIRVITFNNPSRINISGYLAVST